MIRYKARSLDGVDYEHVIYERHDALPRGIRVFHYDDIRMAVRGDHVRDTAGRVVPVLYRRQLNRHTGVKALMMVFPGQTWVSDKHGQKPFTWALRSEQETMTRMNQRHFLFARLLAQGVNDSDAYHKLWPAIPKRAIKYKLMGLYANNDFLIIFLKELGIVADFKKLLEERGVTVETMTDMMVDMINDKKENPTLRKMAFDRIMDALTTKEKAADRITDGFDINAINATVQLQLTSHASMASSSGPEPTARLLEEGDAEILGTSESTEGPGLA